MNQGQPAAEARRTSRHAPDTTVPVVDAMSSDLIGFVIDLSAGGMKLMAGEALVDDALYQVQFDLDLDQHRKVSIEAGTQVVSQRRNPDRGAVVGLRFIHMEGKQAQRLREWLQSRRA